MYTAFLSPSNYVEITEMNNSCVLCMGVFNTARTALSQVTGKNERWKNGLLDQRVHFRKCQT